MTQREVELPAPRRLAELEREVAHRLADVCRLWPFGRYRELVHAIAVATLEYERGDPPPQRPGSDPIRADDAGRR